MNETKELGNWVHNIQLTWLAGTRYDREIILTGQIASASQEISEGSTNSNKGSKNWKKGIAHVLVMAPKECERMCQAALIENIAEFISRRVSISRTMPPKRSSKRKRTGTNGSLQSKEGVQRAEREVAQATQVQCKESHTRIPGPMKWWIR